MEVELLVELTKLKEKQIEITERLQLLTWMMELVGEKQGINFEEEHKKLPDITSHSLEEDIDGENNK